MYLWSCKLVKLLPKGFLLGKAAWGGGGGEGVGTEVFLQTYRKVSSAFKQRLKTSLWK